MRVEQPQITRGPLGSRFEASVQGETLFWELPETVDVEPRGEAFVCALLPIAMRTGTPIELPDELPIDATFQANIDRLQAVFTRWYPGLSPVTIRGTVAPRSVTPSRRVAGYSGGVDSSYTVDSLAPLLDGALLIDGIEYRNEAPVLFAQVRSTLAEALAPRLPLMVVRTNVKTFGRNLGAQWSMALGGAIASAVHAAGFAEYHLAASNTWENLRPYGSHPLTDPLWSGSGMVIHHHGAELRRIDKLRHLKGVPELLSRLRVCFQGDEYNCGKCQKCVMTMTGLRVVEATSSAIPPLTDPRLLRHVTIEHDGDLVDWAEMLVPDLGERDPVLRRELSRLVRRYQWRQVAQKVDALATGGRFRKFFVKKPV